MTNRHYYKWDEEKQVCTGYIRHGECKQCGKCCEAYIQYRVAGKVTKDNRSGGDSIIAGTGIWSEISLNGNRIFFETKKIKLKGKRCSSLEKNNLCRAHEENFAICAEWPFNPTDLEHFPDCGYSFEENGKWTYEEIEEK